MNPEYQKNAAKIKDLRDKIKRNASQGRQNFEKEWYRNVLFYAGLQWIKFDKTSKRWGKPKDMPWWIPNPVTNKFASAVDTIKSVLTQRDPRITITPATNDEKNIATAEIGEDINDTLDKESGISEVRKSSAAWGVTVGNVFAYSFYDTSEEHGMISVDVEKCNSCGEPAEPDAIVENENSCPKCSGKDFGVALNPDGSKKQMTFPKGKLTTETLSPFETFFSNEIQDFYKSREVVISKVKSIDELKRQYKDFADQLVPVSGAAAQLSEYYMTSIAYVTGTSASGNTPGNVGSDKIEKGMVDVVFSLPSDDFPQGLCATLVGDVVVEADELWSKDITGKYFIPIAFFGGLHVPGRVWKKAPVEDLIPKQIQRNVYESMIELSLRRMGLPNWLIPEQCKVDDITGQGGQKIAYNASLNGAKPEMVPGVPVNQSLFQAIEMIDKEMEDLAATYDALRGETPVGLKAFSALKFLSERGHSRHIEIIRNWEDYNRRIKVHQIEIARMNFTEPRKRTLSNKNGVWETRQFDKSDLQSDINVEVESGSAIPKSQAAEQAQLMELQGAGILDMNDPRVKYKFMERMGQADMLSGVDEDVKDAGREWHDFIDSVPEYEKAVAAKDPHPEAFLKLRFRMDVDNHAIHYLEHVARAKTPEFFALAPEVQDVWIAHLQMHKQAMQPPMGAMPEPGQPQPGQGPAKPPPAAMRTDSLEHRPL